MKSYMARPEDVRRKWYVVDAADQVLGRLATRVANILRGKDKPAYTPHVDTGDFVVVINAEKVALTGKKELQKKYYRHSGYPGGLKTSTLKQVRAKHPERIVMHAVKGMVPDNPLGRSVLKKLKVYAGSEHPHAAQKPETLAL